MLPYNRGPPEVKKVFKGVESWRVSLISAASTSLAIKEVAEWFVRWTLQPVNCIIVTINGDLLNLGRPWPLPFTPNFLRNKLLHTRFRFFFNWQIGLKSRTMVSHCKKNSSQGIVAPKVRSVPDKITNDAYILGTRRKRISQCKTKRMGTRLDILEKKLTDIQSRYPFDPIDS